MFNEDAVLVLTVGAVEPMGRCVRVVTPTLGLGGLPRDRSLRGSGGRFWGGGFQELPTAVPSQWFGDLLLVTIFRVFIIFSFFSFSMFPRHFTPN